MHKKNGTMTATSGKSDKGMYRDSDRKYHATCHLEGKTRRAYLPPGLCDVQALCANRGRGRVDNTTPNTNTSEVSNAKRTRRCEMQGPPRCAVPPTALRDYGLCM
jgi:hypothetical protein